MTATPDPIVATCPHCRDREMAFEPTDDGFCCGGCGCVVAVLPGQRVRLLSAADAYTELRPGALGTVTSVDGLGTVHVSWDCGSQLGLVPGEDDWATE